MSKIVEAGPVETNVDPVNSFPKYGRVRFGLVYCGQEQIIGLLEICCEGSGRIDLTIRKEGEVQVGIRVVLNAVGDLKSPVIAGGAIGKYFGVRP